MPLSDSAWRAAESAAGRTFFRAEAAPSAPGLHSFVQLYNPPDSGVDVHLDSFWTAGGYWPSASEFWVQHYSYRLDDPLLNAPNGSLRGSLHATRLGGTPSKAKIYVCNYYSELGPLVQYFLHAPNTECEPMSHRCPFPVILPPAVGIVFGNCVQGLEAKAAFWIREVPIAV